MREATLEEFSRNFYYPAINKLRDYRRPCHTYANFITRERVECSVILLVGYIIMFFAVCELPKGIFDINDVHFTGNDFDPDVQFVLRCVLCRKL